MDFRMSYPWINQIILVFVVIFQVNTQTQHPRTGYGYLAYPIRRDGVLTNVNATVTESGTLYVQLWRHVKDNEYRLKFAMEKTTLRYDSKRSSTKVLPLAIGGKCYTVQKGDMIGVLATGPEEPFPLDFTSEGSTKKKKMRSIPEQGRRYTFKDSIPMRIMITANTRGLTDSEQSAEKVDCFPQSSSTSSTTSTTTTTTTTTTTPPPRTDKVTTSPVLYTTDTPDVITPTVSDSGNVTANPKGVTTLPIAMYAGLGGLGGVLLLIALIVTVVICRKRKSPHNESSVSKSADSNAYTTSSIQPSTDPVSEGSMSKNPMYGVNMGFMSPYDNLSPDTRRPISMHDYSPMIPARQKPAVPNKPAKGTLDQLRVPMPGLTKENPTGKRENPYLDILAGGEYEEINTTSNSELMERQISNAYEEVKL